MLIDPVTNKVVGEIKGIEVNHGAAAAPDGSRLYITNEAESTLDVADLKTLKVIKHIPLTNHPNNVAVSKDGERVYVAIVAGAGAIDVIDTASLTPRQEHSHRRRHPQRLRHPRREVRRRRIDSPAGRSPSSIRRPKRSCGRCRPTKACGRWRSKRTRTARPSGFFVQLSNFNGFVTVDFASMQAWRAD